MSDAEIIELITSTRRKKSEAEAEAKKLGIEGIDDIDDLPKAPAHHRAMLGDDQGERDKLRRQRTPQGVMESVQREMKRQQDLAELRNGGTREKEEIDVESCEREPRISTINKTKAEKKKARFFDSNEAVSLDDVELGDFDLDDVPRQLRPAQHPREKTNKRFFGVDGDESDDASVNSSKKTGKPKRFFK